MPASTWEALVSHVRDPADLKRLADSAKARLLYCYAIPLYRHASDDGIAVGWLARLLVRRGDLDEAMQILRTRADVGDWYAADQLAGLLLERGDVDELRARATPATGPPPGGLPTGWLSAGTWTRPCRSCSPATASAAA